MHGFTYTLTLIEPVLANSLGGEPNSANSLFYIPGGLIRGAAVNAYPQTKDAADDDTFRRLFLTGETRYLNAYPLSEFGRALPTPLKFKAPKYFGGGDLSSLQPNYIQALEEIWQINVHTQRDAEAGHAKEEAGAVYRYIALPAGLVLEGAVLTADQADADALKTLLTERTVLLGKARTAGYGTAKITTSALRLNEGTDNLSGDFSKFTLTLLSPAIVRDPYGQPTLDISTVLSSRFDGVDVTVTEAYQRAEVVGGFNRTWGLPLPQVTAIAAGSHFVVEANVSADQLNALQESGIGERRAEGFGRVAVNLSLPDIEPFPEGEKQWSSISARTEDLAKSEKKLGQNKTAALMLKRVALKELDEAVIHAARGLTSEYKGNIPNSQLSRWRVAFRNALDETDNSKLLDFLKDSKGKTGWKKLEKARVFIGEDHRPRLTEWIDDMLNHPEKLYASAPIQSDFKHALGENTFAMSDELNREYRLRLLDAVLAVMSKKNGGSND